MIFPGLFKDGLAPSIEVMAWAIPCTNVEDAISFSLIQ
jgi:hypothetical protein